MKQHSRRELCIQIMW